MCPAETTYTLYTAKTKTCCHRDPGRLMVHFRPLLFEFRPSDPHIRQEDPGNLDLMCLDELRSNLNIYPESSAVDKTR